MIALLICLCVVAAAIVMLLVLRSVEQGRERRKRLEGEDELARTGLSPTLGAYSWALAGTKDGARLTIESSVNKALPGRSPESDERAERTWLTGASAGPDVIVCRRDLTDAIAGPLSTIPKRKTGDADFDARYDVLTTDPAFDATWFPPARVRRALMDLGLSWLRRKDGALEVLTRRLTKNQARALVDVGVGLSRPQSDGPIVVAPPEEIVVDTPSLTWPIYLALGSLVAIGPAGAMLLALAPPVQSMFGDLACPDGFWVQTTSSHVGPSTYYGAVCRRGTDWQALSWLYFFSCGVLTAAMTSVVGMAFSAKRALASR